MEKQIIILFCMLLSLFLLFSAASAMVLSLRRKCRCRVSAIVWGVLFLLPLLPLSLPAERIPAKLVLTTDWENNKVLSILPADAEPVPTAPLLYADENGEIHINSDVPRRENTAELPEGLRIPAVLWEILLYTAGAVLFFWLMLSLAHLTHRVCGYIGSIHFLTSRSSVCYDERLCAIFEAAAGQVRLHRKPVLRVVEEGIYLSPCTAGFFTPTVYISHVQSAMAPDALEYIFLHELCHVKRHDFFLKALALLSTSLHFMAPFAGEVRRQVYEDCEFGCDRMVLSLIGKSRISRYMQTILDIAEQKLQGSMIHGELFSYASSGKELLLRRYRNLQEEKTVLPLSCRLRMTAAVFAVCLLHLGLFSAVDTRPAGNPLIDLKSPFLETVLREYFDLAPEEMLTMSHLNRIYSLEFSLSRKIDRESLPEGTLALCCTVNEGKYPLDPDTAGQEWAALLPEEGLADGVTPTLQQYAEALAPAVPVSDTPAWIDMRYDCAVDLLPDACPLSVLERYLPDADRERFLSYYRCLDGTPAVLEEYAARTYVTVIQENGLDVAASETEIREAFVRYCRDNGIAYDPDRPDTLGQLAEHLRSQILVQSPAALAFPMAFLDPAIPEEEQAALVKLLHTEGLFSGKLLTGMEPDATGRYALDLSDLELFGNLRTVILNDRLVMEDKTALTEGWCAVIER